MSTVSASKGATNGLDFAMQVLVRVREVIVTSQHHLIAGAVARLMSIAAMYPVDTLKTRLQASGAKALDPLKVLFEGGNPYRGIIPSLLGQTPYGMLVYGSYETYKQLLREFAPNVGERVNVLIAAALGDLTGSIWLCPSEVCNLDVVKQQQQSGMFANVGSAVSATFRESGIGGFYRGYSGLLVRDIPFRVSLLFFYEEFKKTFDRIVKREPRPIENLFLGALAGTIAAGLTTPLDLVKTRLMTQSAASSGIVYKGALDCIQKTFQAEGIPGFFRGLGPRVFLIAPSNAVFFFVYEATVSMLKARSTPKAQKTASFSPSSCTRQHLNFPQRTGALC